MAAKKKSAKKKVLVKKLPFWLIGFSCTRTPVTSRSACADSTEGPFATEEEAKKSINAFQNNYGEKFDSVLIVQAVTVAVMPEASEYQYTKV